MTPYFFPQIIFVVVLLILTILTYAMHDLALNVSTI